jgi:hypothetical protein
MAFLVGAIKGALRINIQQFRDGLRSVNHYPCPSTTTMSSPDFSNSSCIDCVVFTGST